MVFPFTEQTFIGVWCTALKKAGLYSVDQQTKRLVLRPHNLRKFFETWGNWSNPAVPECLAGHIEGMRKIYQRMDQAEKIMVEEYKKAELNLTLFGVVEVQSKEAAVLKDSLTQYRLEVLEQDREVHKLKDQVEELNKKIQEQNNLIQMVVDRLVWLEGDVTDKDEEVKARIKS